MSSAPNYAGFFGVHAIICTLQWLSGHPYSGLSVHMSSQFRKKRVWKDKTKLQNCHLSKQYMELIFQVTYCVENWS